jgi:hypothetical protein
LLKAAFEASRQAGAAQQANAARARQLLQPSLALLQHLTGRLRLFRDAADVAAQLQSRQLLLHAISWVDQVVEPVAAGLEFSDGSSSSSAGGSSSLETDVLTNFAAVQPALQAFGVIYQAAAELCKVEAALIPRSATAQDGVAGQPESSWRERFSSAAADEVTQASALIRLFPRSVNKLVKFQSSRLHGTTSAWFAPRCPLRGWPECALSEALTAVTLAAIGS